MLHSAPSFSVFNSNDGSDELDGDERLERSATIGNSIEATGSGEFSFVKNTMGLIEEGDDDDEENARNGFQNVRIEGGAEPISPPMHLATGYRTEGEGFGGGSDFNSASFDDPGTIEEHYKRMVAEDPCNPLFLRNYAQFLEFKGNLPGAEEFYLRATLADPQDGEILLHVAKLVWELHHDQDRASSYFERAAQAAPENSNILAAYAKFLWELDEDEEEDHTKHDHLKNQETEDSVGTQNSAGEEEKEVDHTAATSGEVGNIEEYYKRMIEQNPCDPSYLRNYAQFLFQCKGDLWEAEKYYSRAVVADPGDGEIISQYAMLIWELHHDRDKALFYFEQAVQASPGDSHVLAAYARFLWETDEE